MTSGAPRHSSSEGSVAEAVAHAAHLLPMQAPLHAFVHHNTLHAFEDQPFAQAVRSARATLGAEPYPSEARFAHWRATGRITPSDIDHVLAHERGGQTPIFEGGPSWLQFARARLAALFDVPARDRLAWILAETPALTALDPHVPKDVGQAFMSRAEREYAALPAQGRIARSLTDLYQLCLEAAPLVPERHIGVRRRDQLLAKTGVDLDLWSHDLLIRFVSAYLDQGVAYWRMEDRERGMLASFRALWSQPLGPLGPIRSQLVRELTRQSREALSAEETIRQALTALGYGPAAFEKVIAETLLSLRGWAGMVRRLEERPDLAPVREIPCSLLDFLAVQLTLDQLAAQFLLSELGGGLTWANLEAEVQKPKPAPMIELAYEAFVSAQLLGLGPFDLPKKATRDAFVRAVHEFNSTERRRILLSAYEWHYQVQVYDALCSVAVPEPKASPSFQAILCIDDREESFRRYIEELDTSAETYGYAGFFSVAMRYQGLEDRRPRALCPPVVDPQHTVYEVALSADEQSRYVDARRARAGRALTVHVSSTSLLRGSLLGFAQGVSALGTMAWNVIAPGLGVHPFHFRELPSHRPKTRLALERRSESSDPNESSESISGGSEHFSPEGFTVAEMAETVKTSLAAMGLHKPSALVYVIGHGSNSVNNPHSSAYNCGATGGGHGGPNARAFAQMANHPEVRKMLASAGAALPGGTWFLGGNHDTANDTLEFYDEDLIPPSHQEPHNKAKEVFAQALEKNAQERCRRFESARLGAGPSEAHTHVHTRATDLGQPRPELGHATNALCVVGRRSRTERIFLDRRAFLVSYDPLTDSEGRVLEALLKAVVPVGSGISLEYYFSTVDSRAYGAGTKLPHNVAGLIAVMDGPQSDLRTGLPWQMVEIHEPMRLLCVIETTPDVLQQVMDRNPAMFEFVKNGWVNLALLSPHDSNLLTFDGSKFSPYRVTARPAEVQSSLEFAIQSRDHLPVVTLSGTSP
jgi:uncharacterized protein